jgi:hypothetical protein
MEIQYHPHRPRQALFPTTAQSISMTETTAMTMSLSMNMSMSMSMSITIVLVLILVIVLVLVLEQKNLFSDAITLADDVIINEADHRHSAEGLNEPSASKGYGQKRLRVWLWLDCRCGWG